MLVSSQKHLKESGVAQKHIKVKEIKIGEHIQLIQSRIQNNTEQKKTSQASNAKRQIKSSTHSISNRPYEVSQVDLSSNTSSKRLSQRTASHGGNKEIQS